MDPGSNDRRRAQRVHAEIVIEIRNAHGFSLHSSRDLSVGGAFFDRSIPHKIGERVKVSFRLPGEPAATAPIACEAEVVNVPDRTDFGMGIHFVGLQPDDERRLRAFTDGLP